MSIFNKKFKTIFFPSETKSLVLVMLAFLAWGVPWSITKKEALPGGNLFGIIILLLSCMAAGWLINHLPLPGIPPLPPLLGKLPACRLVIELGVSSERVKFKDLLPLLIRSNRSHFISGYNPHKRACIVQLLTCWQRRACEQ